MTDTILEALSSDSGDFAPIFKFVNPGDSITGELVDDPVTLPLNAFGTTEPKIGKDGNPVMQIMAVLDTEQLKDENHDGQWRTYIDKPLMKAAVLKALKLAGASTLQRGGRLTITHTGMKQLGNGQAKDFTATYELPPEDGGPLGFGELGETGAVWGDDGPVA